MSERHYTIHEINRMRGYLREILLFNGVKFGLDRKVEDHLRTYMQNGTSVEELKEERRRVWRIYYPIAHSLF